MTKDTQQIKVYTLSLDKLVERLRDDFKSADKDFILLYAYNGTGKTRLSMAFKEFAKREAQYEEEAERDTLYFNAFTEDLFTWDNDLDGDERRVLRLNPRSRFFDGLEGLSLDGKIREYLHRYASFNFDKIDYDNWEIAFFNETAGERCENIKISRGEERIFVWCFFLAIMELALSIAEAYSWVKYIYR